MLQDGWAFARTEAVHSGSEAWSSACLATIHPSDTPAHGIATVGDSLARMYDARARGASRTGCCAADVDRRLCDERVEAFAEHL